MRATLPIHLAPLMCSPEQYLANTNEVKQGVGHWTRPSLLILHLSQIQIISSNTRSQNPLIFLTMWEIMSEQNTGQNDSLAYFNVQFCSRMVKIICEAKFSNWLCLGLRVSEGYSNSCCILIDKGTERHVEKPWTVTAGSNNTSSKGPDRSRPSACLMDGCDTRKMSNEWISEQSVEIYFGF